MSKIKAMTGNQSASIGACLSRPDVIAAYPITPQSSVVEGLAAMIADGKSDAQMVQVESEHSAMSVVQGSAMAGGRVFTATSAQGLALMYEPYFRMSTLRLPMVMAIATREMTSPETVWSGQQDAMSVRDSGWIQVFVENNQEILDMIIQGYKISEDKDVLIPMNVCYDGFYLSHLTERVEIPSQEQVDEFLPRYKCEHVAYDPKNPMAVDPLTPGEILINYRENHLQSMQKVKDIIEKVDREFKEKFGRSYGGLIDTYRCEDAEIVVVTIGANVGTTRVAVDLAREKGKKVGLIKVRFMRPFPNEKIAEVLSNKKGYAVIDRSVSFGWNSGVLYQEVKAAVSDLNQNLCSISAIGGLGGLDISLNHVMSVIDVLDKAIKEEKQGQLQTMWLK